MGRAKAVSCRKLPTTPARRKGLAWPMVKTTEQLQKQKGLQKENGSKKTNRKGRWCRCGAVQPGLDSDICCKRSVCALAQDWIELWMGNGKCSKPSSCISSSLYKPVSELSSCSVARSTYGYGHGWWPWPVIMQARLHAERHCRRCRVAAPAPTLS